MGRIKILMNSFLSVPIIGEADGTKYLTKRSGLTLSLGRTEALPIHLFCILIDVAFFDVDFSYFK